MKKKNRKIRVINGQLISNFSTQYIPDGNEHRNNEPEPVELDLSDLEDIDLSEFVENLPEKPIEQSLHPFLAQAKDVKPDDFIMIDGILHPKDQAYLPESQRPELPVKQEIEFCPYLITGDNSDFSGYLYILESTGKSKRTIQEYGLHLRKWKRLLDGEITVEKYNAILKDIETSGKPYQAIKMRNALKSYAWYRNARNDSQLIVMLTVSQSLYNPKAPVQREREKPTDELSEREAEIYWNKAKMLCKQHEREGIWMALLMLGCPPGAIKDVEFPNKSTVTCRIWGKLKDINIESWLYGACQTVENWKLGRKAVYNGVSRYEVSPRSLNHCRDFDFR